MEPIRKFSSRTLILPTENVDTDQIIPARFLKITTRTGLADGLFANQRVDPKFPLNHAKGEQVLVAGDNFGIGSSREHAPWALLDFGFRAVVSTSIADIFRNNSLKNGLLPIVVPKDVHAKLLAQPQTVTVDLDSRTIALEDGTVATFPVDAFARYCLLNGIDELGFLLQQQDAIEAFESSR